MHESDSAAVAAVTAGDRQAFRALVERHSRYVHQVVYRLVGDRADADDVVQETFLKAYRQLRPLRGQGRLPHLDPPHRRELRDRPHPGPAPS